MAVSIVADTRGDYRYFTYYMAGLEQVLGKGCVHYDVRPFSGLAYRTWFQLNSRMPVIVADGDKRLKIFSTPPTSRRCTATATNGATFTAR